MIVSRKPCTIYDVDVIGVAALVVTGLAAWFGVIVPASANATEYQALSARIAAAETKLEHAGEQLRNVNARITALQNGVADRTRDAPKSGALTPFVQCAASLAEECELQVAQVLPQPVRHADGYLIGDVWFSGRGTSLNFARFLDQLARVNPYHGVEGFSIKRSGGEPDDPECALSWTLRLYMLEDAPGETPRLRQAGEKP